jgi:hypothetical protein
VLRDVLRTWRRRLARGWRRRVALGAVSCGAIAVALLAGVRAADAIAPALGAPDARAALVLGLVLPALAGGVALGASLPSPVAALGEQLASGPAPVADRCLAALVPVAPAALGGVLLLAPALVPVAAASPAGWAAVVPLLLLALGALAVGAGLVAALRAPGRLARGAAAPALGCVLTASWLRAPSAGSVLASPTEAARAGMVMAPLVLAALVAWSLVQMSLPPATIRGARRWSSPRRPAALVGQAVVLLLLRRSDVRIALAGALLLGGATGIAAWALGAVPPTGGLLAASAAALAGAPVGLAVAGALRAGAHAWSLAPALALVLGSWLAVGVGLGFVPVGTVALVNAVTDGAAATSGLLVAVGLSVALLAVLAGALVAWRPGEVAAQAASLGVFALLCAGTSAALAVLGPRLAELGVDGAQAGGVTVLLLVVLAVLALGHALRGES